MLVLLLRLQAPFVLTGSGVIMGSGILLLTPRVGVVKGKAVAIPLPLCCCAEPLEVTSAGRCSHCRCPVKMTSMAAGLSNCNHETANLNCMRLQCHWININLWPPCRSCVCLQTVHDHHNIYHGRLSPCWKHAGASHTWDHIPKGSLGPDRTPQRPRPAATASRAIHQQVNCTCMPSQLTSSFHA